MADGVALPERGTASFPEVFRTPGVATALAFGLRLWASVVLALFLAFWLQLENPFWAGTSAAIVCQPTLGASLRKASSRLAGTVLGAIAIVVLMGCFPQSRAGLILALAGWCGLCGFAATVLRNFAGYGAALAGYTAVIIASDAIADPAQVFALALARATEICLGIVCAGIVLSLTDSGTARRRAASAIAALIGETRDGFIATLGQAGETMVDSSPARRALVEQAIALSALLDEAAGESSEIRARSAVLQGCVDGLFDALSEWRAAATHLEAQTPDTAGGETSILIAMLRPGTDEWRPERGRDFAARSQSAAASLQAQATDSPAIRLLLDRAASVLLGLAAAAQGVALLTGESPGEAKLRGARLRTPDLLPALLNGLRAAATILAVSLFWIVTSWPSGATALLFAAIVVILFSPRGDEAFGSAIGFWAGTMITAGLAAIADFALLPGREGFAALALILALFLIPTAALSAQDWHRSTFIAMCTNFVPLLAPANLPSYDTGGFYNAALAIGVGVGFGALAIALLPQLPAPLRARRLVGLSLRDLRQLAGGRCTMDERAWRSLIYGRLAALPEAADPLQRTWLITMLWTGVEIIRIEAVSARAEAVMAPALAAIRRADSRAARLELRRVEEGLASGQIGGSLAPALVMRVRAAILGLGEALARHAAFFDSSTGPGRHALL